MCTERNMLEKLLKDIGMSETYSPVIMTAFDKYAQNGSKLDISSIRAALNSPDIYSDQARNIMLFLLLAAKERENGVWTRFPEDIFINTMSDFAGFVRFYKKATGEEGYGKGVWPFHYVNAHIFRLGAFEYEIIEENEKRRVEMHIPEGTALRPDVLKASLLEKEDFFKQYLSEWNDIPIECHSWMLSPVLKDMLPPDSKLIWFMSMFDIFDTDPSFDIYLQFVFDLEYFQWCNGYDLSKLREDTSLQRKMKQFVLSGGKPGVGMGYLNLKKALE